MGWLCIPSHNLGIYNLTDIPVHHWDTIGPSPENKIIFFACKGQVSDFVWQELKTPDSHFSPIAAEEFIFSHLQTGYCDCHHLCYCKLILNQYFVPLAITIIFISKCAHSP